MKHPKAHLSLITRYPVAGRAKTRMIPALGEEGAAQLQREMSEHVALQMRILAATGDAFVDAWIADGSPLASRRWLRIPGRAQVDGDLGAKLRRALSYGRARAPVSAVVGGDCPTVSAADMREALNAAAEVGASIIPATDGGFSPSQHDWLITVLANANDQGKSVIAMGHHGIVEHWDGQRKLHPEYLVDDYKRLGEMLASWGVRAWFSGHYHAQDIVRADFGGNGFLYDVETGSIATAPCPMRLCEISGGEMKVTSSNIVELLYPGTDFPEKAGEFILATIESEAYDVSRDYNVNEENSAYIADRVAPSFVIHYAGDEDPADIPTIDTSNLTLWGKFIWSQQAYVVEGLSHDRAPADNNVTLDLRK